MTKILFVLIISICANITAQVIHTSGKYILGPCNDTLILKGVNYAPYNYGYSPNQLNLNQIGLSKANCVRMPWYLNAGTTPNIVYTNLVKLDSALSKCIQQKMIAIVDLHDQTCQNNPSNVSTLAQWWVQPAILALINKYKHSFILNIVNEALYVNWASSPTTALTTFTQTYAGIVSNLRSNGITVPLLIDGPDCGTNLDVLANVGQALIAIDPLQNLIFSPHGYWYSFANNDSTQMATKINYAISKNIPFVFGEIANLQDDQSLCQYTLNYQALLRICKQKKIGWLAWSWDNDGCATRQVSTAGNFNSLTAYGNDIINNTQYGIFNTAIRSLYLTQAGCVVTNLNTNFNNDTFSFSLFPNPANNQLIISSVTQQLLKIISISGNVVTTVMLNAGSTIIPTHNLASGFYIVVCNNQIKKLVINHN